MGQSTPVSSPTQSALHSSSVSTISSNTTSITKMSTSTTKEDQGLCKDWKAGLCIWGNLCLHRHYYTDRDVIRARLDQWLVGPTRREEVVFTSPLTVKVYEEVKEKRTE